MNGSAVRAYSLAKDGGRALTPHFRVREFACSDGTDTVFVSDELVQVLEKIRTRLGKAVYINSGYRTEAKKRAVGGAAYSRHKYGMAADISVKGVSPGAVAAAAEEALAGGGGIGVYGGFVHVDVRPGRSRWAG